ncbi:hypothetical protein D9758_002045 [Tetrapyrgos nigripes]|uniref:Transglutaminase-like domain-containing protein n=1 Tax=Tetrapyrgos nigripes TaxID=182062 RepID=A0A8H5GTQ1_9AGAR|nr:hypothetical protein D9758_002045 [Tetrapyrgos nigripes]
MSVPRPPVPPRRSVPPVPSLREEPEQLKPSGLAARIANLQLNHVARAPSHQPPRIRQADTSTGPRRPTWEEIQSRGSEYVRAVKRTPPSPPPPSKPEQPPPVPGRRLPPKPSRLPTPPPEPVYEPTSELEHSEQSDSCLHCHDFSFVDDHAAQLPRETVPSLHQLAYDLTAPWESETEKFRAIFAWMHHNIAYDAAAFLSGNIGPQSPETVLRSGLAVCDGYAQLCSALAEKAGLQALRVGGHGKGYGYSDSGPDAPLPAYQGNHAWNCALMDGEWRLIDCCWGAGVLEGSSYKPAYNPSWFTMGAVDFGKKHYPEDPGHQLIAEEDGGPVSWRDYILSPEAPRIFGGWTELNLSPHFLQPNTKYIQSLAWASFHIFKWCEHMSTDEAVNHVYFLTTPDDQKIPMHLNQEGGWSAQVYIPKCTGEVSLCYLTTLDGRDAKGVGNTTFTDSLGRKAMSWAYLAKWSVV